MACSLGLYGKKCRSHCKCTAILLQLMIGTTAMSWVHLAPFRHQASDHFLLSDSGRTSPPAGAVIPNLQVSTRSPGHEALCLGAEWAQLGPGRAGNQTKCLGSVDSECGWVFIPLFFPWAPPRPSPGLPSPLQEASCADEKSGAMPW